MSVRLQAENHWRYQDDLDIIKESITDLLNLENEQNVGGFASISLIYHIVKALADRRGSKVIDSRELPPYFIPILEKYIEADGYTLEWNPFEKTSLDDYSTHELVRELYKRTGTSENNI